MTDPEDFEWTEVEMGWCRISSHYKCRGWFQDTDHSGLICTCQCHRKDAE